VALDNCGGQRSVICGLCNEGSVCGLYQTGRCGDPACEPESDAAVCLRLGATCGRPTATDNCGQRRTVDCGGCPVGESCGAVRSYTCGVVACTPESDRQFCQRLAKNCGAVSAYDNCFSARTVSCGSCAFGESCGAELPNVCGSRRVDPLCNPESDGAFCARLGKNCGEVLELDNCGSPRTVDCGGCDGRCGGEVPNVCQPVVIGAACDSCGSDLCYNFSGSGYCSARCGSDADCPSGATCLDLRLYGLERACIERCVSSAQCRAGTRCRPLITGFSACY
jgi:hypothetical protein